MLLAGPSHERLAAPNLSGSLISFHPMTTHQLHWLHLVAGLELQYCIFHWTILVPARCLVVLKGTPLMKVS